MKSITITANLESIEIAPLNWPIKGRWQVRIWHKGKEAECFGIQTLDSREQAHIYAQAVPAVQTLGSRSV